jgi:8-oxo-dGTP diphosphatase
LLPEAGMTETLVVGGALVEEGRVLLGKRRSGQSLEGFWEFPGGKVEPGESPEAALVREFREELGLDVRVSEFLGSGQGSAEGRSIRLLVYRVERFGFQEPVGRVHEAFGWFRAEELSSLAWPEADRPLLPALMRCLEAQETQGKPPS